MACFYAGNRAGFKGPYIVQNTLYQHFLTITFLSPDFKRNRSSSNEKNQSKHWLITQVELILM